MKRQLYVCSKTFDDGPRLIGVLSEENGSYEFKYKLGGKLQEWFLRLRDFPEIDRVYRGTDVRRFIYRMTPSEDDTHIDDFLRAANMEKFDEWEMLKHYGKNNPRYDAFLYETLPEGTIVYEQ